MTTSETNTNATTEPNPIPKRQTRSLFYRVLSGFGTLSVAAILIGLAATAISTLHLRAGAEPARQPSPPVPATSSWPARPPASSPSKV